jgi:hypothetical protein
MILAHCQIIGLFPAKWFIAHDVARSTIAQENVKLLHGRDIKNTVAAVEEQNALKKMGGLRSLVDKIIID